MNTLVEVEQLAATLDDPDLVVIDCRFDLLDPEAGRKQYAEAHIPGARYASLDDDLAREPGPDDGRHPLPHPEDFAARLEALGVSNSSFVVAHDEGAGAIAARLWWMLRWLGHERVAVLNGGLAAWRASTLPMTDRSPPFGRGSFVPERVNADWTVSVSNLEDSLGAGNVVFDARAAPRYRGDHEPIDPVAGHIPGAENLPFSECLADDGRLLPPPELRTVFANAMRGRDADQVIAMCGSGVTACHLLLAMNRAGIGDGRLYVGSWSEWIRNPERPIATGSIA